MLKWKNAKDPSDADFYDIKVGAAWLGADVIDTVTHTVTPGSGLSVAAFEVNHDVVRTFISGGVVGEHQIEVTITTESGRILQRTVALEVAEQ